MANNALKTPLVGSLNSNASRKAYDALLATGKSLPCSVVSVNGAIVTVKFEVTTDKTLPNITVPIAAWICLRPAVSVDDLGIVRPSDTLIGNISGLGQSGAPRLDQPPGNLGSLVFEPVSNVGWFSVPAGVTDVWGPNGVQIHNGDNTMSFVMTNSRITATAGSHTLILDKTNGFFIDGEQYSAHQHTNVTNGPDDTGGVL